MNEPEFARLAKLYLNWLARQNDQRPTSWSQQDHLRELAYKDDLLFQMRAILNHQQ